MESIWNMFLFSLFVKPHDDDSTRPAASSRVVKLNVVKMKVVKPHVKHVEQSHVEQSPLALEQNPLLGNL